MGVVRSMARSDHWRCVSIPKWARHSSNVVSKLQRAHKGLYDLLGSLRLIGGKQRFWRSLAVRIADQNPADGQRLVSLSIPQGDPRADLQIACSLPIPIQGD